MRSCLCQQVAPSALPTGITLLGMTGAHHRTRKGLCCVGTSKLQMHEMKWLWPHCMEPFLCPYVPPLHSSWLVMRERKQAPESCTYTWLPAVLWRAGWAPGLFFWTDGKGHCRADSPAGSARCSPREAVAKSQVCSSLSELARSVKDGPFSALKNACVF